MQGSQSFAQPVTKLQLPFRPRISASYIQKLGQHEMTQLQQHYHKMVTVSVHYL